MEVNTSVTISRKDKTLSLTLDLTDHDETSFKETVISVLAEEDNTLSFSDEEFADKFILSQWSEELEAMKLVSEKGISSDAWELGQMSYGEIDTLYAWYKLQRNSGTDIIDNARQAEDAFIGYFENDDELVRYMQTECEPLDAEESTFLKELNNPNKVKEYYLNQTENYEHWYFRA